MLTGALSVFSETNILALNLEEPLTNHREPECTGMFTKTLKTASLIATPLLLMLSPQAAIAGKSPKPDWMNFEVQIDSAMINKRGCNAFRSRCRPSEKPCIRGNIAEFHPYKATKIDPGYNGDRWMTIASGKKLFRVKECNVDYYGGPYCSMSLESLMAGEVCFRPRKQDVPRIPAP